jgi:hypothetical protein
MAISRPRSGLKTAVQNPSGSWDVTQHRRSPPGESTITSQPRPGPYLHPDNRTGVFPRSACLLSEIAPKRFQGFARQVERPGNDHRVKACRDRKGLLQALSD